MSGTRAFVVTSCIDLWASWLVVVAGIMVAAGTAFAEGGAESPAPTPARGPDYRFGGRISRAVLENYLARAVTQMDLLHEPELADENLRMLRNIGAKFAGRAIYAWGREGNQERRFASARRIAAKIHKADPDMILQGCIFEIVSTEVNGIAMPAWLFEEFGRPVEKRSFRYADMLYPNGLFRNKWGRGRSVPDMSRLETRMWFVYVARRYVDLGVEAIHFGQVRLMDHRDRDHVHWRDMMARVRACAAKRARRRLLICDAHVPKGGIVHDGKLMFDFHSFPLRIAEVPGDGQRGELRMGYLDSLFGRSKGGVTPSGWSCKHLPYLVELDNFGVSRHPGTAADDCFVWGYDEICWFARQSGSYRNDWLRYAWKWVREHDANGFLQMPGSRCLAASPDRRRQYRANTASPACPDGFNQEQTIRAIWAADRRR